MPTSVAPSRSAPHAQPPSGRCATCSSGLATHGSEPPGAPFCLPRSRPDPFAGRGRGFFRPGRSSLDGDIEEFPLLRPRIRSSAVTRSTNPAFALVNSSIERACSAITTSRDAHHPHPGTAGGGDVDSVTAP